MRAWNHSRRDAPFLFLGLMGFCHIPPDIGRSGRCLRPFPAALALLARDVGRSRFPDWHAPVGRSSPLHTVGAFARA